MVPPIKYLNDPQAQAADVKNLLPPTASAAAA
jgi:hypothetical protein